MRFEWLQDLFAVPDAAQALPRQIAKFAIGVCPGCRQLRTVASLRCTYCGSAALVTEDA